MKNKKEYEEWILKNSCMQMNHPDTVVICDGIHLLAHILLDVRELLQGLTKAEQRRAS